MTMVEILPLLTSFSPGESVGIEIRGLEGSAELSVWHLGECLTRQVIRESGTTSVGPLPEGGYGVELKGEFGTTRTAVEVTADSRSRLRYGFVTDYSPGRNLSGFSDNIRRLHLSGIQFYDWAYRHADLLGGGENYQDALDQPISMESVRRLIETVKKAGSSALGYAAVYAVGPREWEKWKGRALLTATGEPYGLGDFLFLLDPASEDWLQHFTEELSNATQKLNFDGFHLDQYGYPKMAVRADGELIDLSHSFDTLINAARAALPGSHLVFNNVNDFPTWATAKTPQDAIYIEVWPPQTTLNSLADVVSNAKAISGRKPVVIAAYQHVYDTAPVISSDLATSFTMATLFSHGATQILAGEADRILVDPYYVRNHKIESSTADLLKRWYDFLVEHDELLLNPNIVDVTNSYAGTYNGDCDVTYASVEVTESAEPESVWRRITSDGSQTIVHLINLLGQENVEWDSERNSPGATGDGVLRARCLKGLMPRVRVADPDSEPKLIEIPFTVDGDFLKATLPPIRIWQMVVIDFSPIQKAKPID